MSRQKFLFTFYEDRCIQCHACESACRTWRDVPEPLSRRKIINAWRGVFPAVRSKTRALSCMHCEDPACLTACPEGAIYLAGVDNIVLVDKDACSGCQVCYEACPFKIVKFDTDGKMDKCDLCFGKNFKPPCVSTCPTGALIIRKRGEPDNI